MVNEKRLQVLVKHREMNTSLRLVRGRTLQVKLVLMETSFERSPWDNLKHPFNLFFQQCHFQSKEGYSQ